MTGHGPRKIAVLTVGRSDFGRYLPVLRQLQKRPDVELRLLPTGGHYSSAHGFSISEIKESGFSWEPGLEMTAASDSPESVGKAIGEGTISLTQAFASDRPDLLVVLGDRYEMLCGVSAALGFNIPVTHIYGGAVTEGSTDELVRHAITKMSHLHLVSCDLFANRVLQMGEEPWRVNVVGAPGLDEIESLASVSREEISRRIGVDLSLPSLFGCFHPPTLESGDLESKILSFIDALQRVPYQIILTYPNSDPGHEIVIEHIENLAASSEGRVRVFKNLGNQLLIPLLAHAKAIVGNSSVGIVECASLRLPAVNIGLRQEGRPKPAHVIDASYDADVIVDAIEKACSDEFRETLADLQNPYGDGHAGPRISEILATVPLDDRLLQKKFNYNGDDKIVAAVQ